MNLRRRLLLLLFLPSFCLSQESLRDSLVTILGGLKEYNTLQDTQKIILLNRIAIAYKGSEALNEGFDYALHSKTLCERLIKQKLPVQQYYAAALFTLGSLYADKNDFLNGWSHLSKALKIYEENKNEDGMAEVYNAMGSLNKNTGNLPKALEYYTKAYNLSGKRNDKNAMAAYGLNISMAYLNSGDYSKATHYLYETVKLNEQLNNKAALASCYLTLGTTYYEQNNHDKALENYFKALKIQEERKALPEVAAVLNNIGNIYLFKPDYKTARDYYMKALKINSENGYNSGKILCLINIGVTYLAEQDYRHALEYLKQSLDLQEKSGDKNGVVESCVNIGIAYYQQAQAGQGNKAELLKQAKLYLEKGYEHAVKLGNPPLIRECYMALSEFSEAADKHVDALSYYKRYVTLRDSLRNEENTANMVRSEMNYEFEKKENAAREEQARKDTLVKAETEKQKVIRNSLIAAFVFMLLLAVVIYRGYRNKRKANFTILRQKKEVENQKHLVDQKQKQIIDSINYAKRIQNSILVSEEEIRRVLPEAFVLFIPKDIVSGDFYWFHVAGSPLDVRGSEKNSGNIPTQGRTPNSELILAVADCTGHGVPGAFLSMVGSTLLNEIVTYKQVTDPAGILHHLAKGLSGTLSNKEKQDQYTDGMDISVCRIDPASGEIHFAGANHCIYEVNETGVKQTDGQLSSVSGIFGLEGSEQVESILLSANRGTMLYMSTDGYADQVGGEKGKKFLASRFEDLLKTIYHLPVEEQKTILQDNFHKWKGSHKQIDDILIVGFRI